MQILCSLRNSQEFCFEQNTYYQFSTWIFCLFQNLFRLGLRWDVFPHKKWSNNTIYYIINAKDYGKLGICNYFQGIFSTQKFRWNKKLIVEIWNNLQPTLRFWLKMLNCECFPSLDSWKNFFHLNYISVSTTLCRKNSSLILDSFNILEVWKKKSYSNFIFMRPNIYSQQLQFHIFLSPDFILLYSKKKPFFSDTKVFSLLFLVYFTLLVKVLAG